MMGGHHAASGAAAWVAVTTTGTGFALLPADPAGVLTGALVCAGAALLPDLDHRKSTLTRALPPLTTVTARVLERVAGGHRAGTHSVVGVLAVGLAMFIGQAAWGPAVASLLLGALALKALKFIPGPRWGWVAALAAGISVGVGQPAEGHWFAVAVGLGVAVHIVGDLFTAGGVGLLWPLNTKRFALPFLGKTGSQMEWLVMVPLTFYALYGLAGQAWILIRSWL